MTPAHHITVQITMPDPKQWGRPVALARVEKVLKGLGPGVEIKIEEKESVK